MYMAPWRNGIRSGFKSLFKRFETSRTLGKTGSDGSLVTTSDGRLTTRLTSDDTPPTLRSSVLAGVGSTPRNAIVLTSILALALTACGGAIDAAPDGDRSVAASPAEERPMLPVEPRLTLLTSIDCELPDGRVISCDARHDASDGFNGVKNNDNGERCARWDWTPRYTGYCARGSSCEAVSVTGEYLEGTCL